MPEKCPYCGGEFQNTKALGSHIRYAHETETWASMSQKRSESEKEQFQKLLESCVVQRGLPKPRRMDMVEPVVTRIPQGVSPDVDRYREAYRCAVENEKLIREFEEDLIREVSSDETQKTI